MTRFRIVAALAMASATVTVAHAQSTADYNADQVEKSLQVSCEDQNRPTLPDGTCGAPYADSRVLRPVLDGGPSVSTPASSSTTRSNSSGYTRPAARPKEAAVTPVYADAKFDLQINFANDSAELSDKAKANAKVFAEAITRPSLAGAKFEIAGHTNAVGGEEYNVELSEKRAAALKDYLVSLGVDPNRLVAHGYGFSEPYVTNQPRAAANRRVEARRIDENAMPAN